MRGHHLLSARGLCWVIILICGCEISPLRPKYSLDLFNRTGHRISQCTVDWGGHIESFGSSKPNGTKGVSFVDSIAPSSARVSWLDVHGNAYESIADVVVPEETPLDKATACLILMPDGTLQVEIVSHEEYHVSPDPVRLCRLLLSDGPRYIIATKNETEQTLSELRIYFAEHQVNAFEDTAGGSKDLNNGWRFAHILPYPITDQARVIWSTPDGKEHEEMVYLKGQLPGDLDGICIVFHIQDDGVCLSTLPWSEACLKP